MTAAANALMPRNPVLGSIEPLDAKQDPRHRRRGARERPGQPVDPFHRDAHVAGRELVPTRPLHGHTELRTVEEGEQQTGQDEGHDDDRNLVEPQHQGAERGVHSGDGALQHLRLVSPDRAGDEAQREADRDGEDHHRDLRLAEDAAQDRTLQQPADRGHGEDRADAGEPERQAQVRVVRETHRDEGAEHHEVALREVDLLGGPVDQHETQGDQAVDAPVCETADDELKVLQVPEPDAAATSGAPGLLHVGSCAKRRRAVRRFRIRGCEGRYHPVRTAFSVPVSYFGKMPARNRRILPWRCETPATSG